MKHKVLLICCAVTLFIFAGCPSVNFFHPLIVKQDIFTVDPQFSDKNVIYVQFLIKVRDTEKPNIIALIGPCNRHTIDADMEGLDPFKCVWAIKATAPVLAKDFQLIPGIVPNGFEQVVPSQEEQFIPSNEQEYNVSICLDPVDDSFYSIGLIWQPSIVQGN